MISLRFDQLAEITDGKLLSVDRADWAERADRTFTGVSLDSRTLQSEQLFVAIRGETNDGHRFVGQAAAAGAAGILAQTGCLIDPARATDIPVVEVPDSHAAMLQLAASYMNTVDARRIGITGSNGKTTTKEFLYRLLSAVADNVYCSPGNYNNLYGIPLAIFAMPTETELAILEMGISVPGEMSRLAGLVRPHLMLVINVGATHLEFLGTVENVAREKLSAMSQAEPNASLIVNADDPILMAEAMKMSSSMVTFGRASEATFSPDRVESDQSGLTVVTIEGHKFRLPLFGDYQIMNLLAAYATVRELGYSFTSVATETIELSSADMRGERVEVRGVTFISDCYNANPESVKAGLASFDSIPSDGRRVVILGDMLELGQASARYHAQAGELMSGHAFDLLVAVGPLAVDIVNGARAAGIACRRILYFETAEACARDLINILKADDLVYLKGSRGIGLEVIMESFGRERGTA